jgi:translation initiation factor IF-3
LKNGDKVKVTLRFRGRERDYKSRGFEVMEQFAEVVSDVADVEKKPKFEGRSLTMFLSPKKSKYLKQYQTSVLNVSNYRKNGIKL